MLKGKLRTDNLTNDVMLSLWMTKLVKDGLLTWTRESLR